MLGLPEIEQGWVKWICSEVFPLKHLFQISFCATLCSEDYAFVFTLDSLLISLLIPSMSKNCLWNVLHFFVAWLYSLHVSQSFYAFSTCLSLNRRVNSLNWFHGIKSSSCRDFNVTGIIIFFSVRERKQRFKKVGTFLSKGHVTTQWNNVVQNVTHSCFFSL